METALEKLLSHSHKPTLLSHITAHPDGFEELLKLATVDKQPYSWRAAWILWSCMEKNDKRIRKHVKNIIQILPLVKDNQKRELMKVLEQMEIKEALEGLLFDHCVSIWEKTDKQPSVRYNAFKILRKITLKHPELSQEISALTQAQYMESLSPVVNRCIHEMIHEFNIA